MFPADKLGVRRPGFSISLEPGFQYTRGPQTFSATIGRAFYRDRTRSVPDVLTGGHGDAAFADYVWLASDTYRYSRHQHHQATDHDSTTHKTNTPAATPATTGSSGF